jgi:hypothetical protein
VDTWGILTVVTVVGLVVAAIVIARLIKCL